MPESIITQWILPIVTGALLAALGWGWARLRAQKAENRRLRDAVGERDGQLVEAAERERQARSEAAEAARARSDFLGNINHDIRTPLNGVIGMTDLLLTMGLNDEQTEFAEAVRSSSETLRAVMDDLLDFARIEEGAVRLDEQRFDLLAAVESVLDLMAEKANRKRIALVSYVNQDVPTELEGDVEHLRQVLINLVGNAVKFTGTGEVVVRVEMKRRSEEEALLRFQVSDTGPGVAPEIEERLFRAFSPGDATPQRVHQGIGLGLYIAQHLVEMLDGTIGFESRQGKGSTFWFTAPLRVAETASEELLSHCLDGLRVLIAEPHDNYRQLLEGQVKAWRMRPDTVHSHIEAIAALRTAIAAGDPYRLAVVDVDSPGLDWQELSREIGEDLSFKPRIVGLHSGGVDTADMAALKGIHALLAKPMKQSELFDSLAALATYGQEAGLLPVARTAPSTPADANRALRILLAEDHPVNQKVTLAQLRRLGYSGDLAPNGVEAVEAHATGHYDIILMDCMMPQMDGYEATRRIRQMEGANRKARIIALTANSTAGEREKCLAAGMDDYVSKPARLDDLGAALERWSGVKLPGASDSEPTPRPRPAVKTASIQRSRRWLSAGSHARVWRHGQNEAKVS